MRKLVFSAVFILLSCFAPNKNIIADLPKTLSEVSGIETFENSNLLWMMNDAGNASKIYGLNTKGKILKTLKINSDNNDWEDLTTDDLGNLYIGDFGNNENHRKDLAILKIANSKLDSKKPIEVDTISFSYPDQKDFPPKKKERFFDCEAFFYFSNSFYIFTKSRVNGSHGMSMIYKIPAVKGNHIATKINVLEDNCNKSKCWITSADISPDKTKIALLTPKKLIVYSNFEKDNFFRGERIEIEFKFTMDDE